MDISMERALKFYDPNCPECRALKFADPNCPECNGTGCTYSGFDDDRREVYCFCAKEAMAQADAEGREE